MIRVTLTEEEVQECRMHARVMMSPETGKQEFYANDRKQGDAVENELRFFYSKASEVAVYKYFLSIGVKTSEVDMTVHPVGHKKTKFAPDLTIISTGYRIHVKSCCQKSKNRYGLGWMLQMNEDPLFQEKTNVDRNYDILALTEVINDYEIDILGFIPIFDALSKMRLPEEMIHWYKKSCLKWEDIVREPLGATIL